MTDNAKIQELMRSLKQATFGENSPERIAILREIFALDRGDRHIRDQLAVAEHMRKKQIQRDLSAPAELSLKEAKQLVQELESPDWSDAPDPDLIEDANRVRATVRSMTVKRMAGELLVKMEANLSGDQDAATLETDLKTWEKLELQGPFAPDAAQVARLHALRAWLAGR